MRDKVQEIFRELVGEKADRLRSDRYLADVNSIITTALAADNPEWSDDDLVEKDGIGQNLIDWQSDAACIVALSLYPERFSQEEVQEGVRDLLLHVPNHVLEAARLAGYPVGEDKG
jgi:hypothetical protein